MSAVAELIAVAKKYKPTMGNPARLKWRPLVVSTKTIISGGFGGNAQDLACVTLRINVPDHGVCDFVELNKKSRWLLVGAKGRDAHKGAFTRSTIIEELKTKASAESEFADDSQELVDEDDPMNAISMGFSEEPKPKKAKRCHKKRRMSHNVQTLEVDVHPPLTNPKQVDGQTPKCLVRLVYISSSRSLFLHVDDVEWLVAYIADELICGGVAVPIEDEKGVAVAAPNSEAVPGLHTEWNFDLHRMEAWFVEGPLCGEEIKKFHSKPGTITEEKWAQVGMHGEFCSATNLQLVDACNSLLVLHCRNLLSECVSQGAAATGV